MESLDFDKALFNKYYRRLCYFARRMVDTDELAEDLAQDAFVSYFENRERISADEMAIKSFLYSSVKFSVFNLSRKRKTIQKFWTRNLYIDMDDVDYERDVIYSEFMGTIYDRIHTLPNGCRRIMTLSFVDGFSNEQIADQLQVSINTIKTQKKRGLKVLREVLRLDYFLIIYTLFY